MSHSVVMLGATGAVGSHAAKTLEGMPQIDRLTLLGRRPLDGVSDEKVTQHSIDIFAPTTYEGLLEGHTSAVCTLGVGEPSKVSKEDFLKIDKLAVLDFARACKSAGIRHFQLLSSVGVSASSSSFFLRTKGELEEALQALGFERLSLFHPSMILTPTNRYGIAQAITLKVWPLLGPFLLGPLRKFRGIRVELLGQAMALNVVTDEAGVEVLEWDQFLALAVVRK